MKTASVAFAAMVLGAAAFAAHAQPVSGAGLLDRLDTDHNGKITLEEATAARQTIFDRIDRNGDGTVDEMEIEMIRQAIYDRAAAAEAAIGIALRRLDKDGDGKVSTAEFGAQSLIFDLADRNGDGAVTPDEIDFLRGLLGRAG